MAVASEITWSDQAYSLRQLKQSRFTYPLLVKVDGGLYGSLDDCTFSADQLMLLHKWEESERIIATSKDTGLQITMPIEHQHKLEIYVKKKEKKTGRFGRPGLYTLQTVVRNYKPPLLARFDPDQIAEFDIEDERHDSEKFGMMQLEGVHYLHYIKASTIDEEGKINEELISILPLHTEIGVFVGKGMCNRPAKHFTKLLVDLATRTKRLLREATNVYTMSGIMEYKEIMDIDYEEITLHATWGRRPNRIVKLPLPQNPEDEPRQSSNTVCIVKPTLHLTLPGENTSRTDKPSTVVKSKRSYEKLMDGPLGYEIPVPSSDAPGQENDYYNDPRNIDNYSKMTESDANENDAPALPPSDKDDYWPLWRTGLITRKASNVQIPGSSEVKEEPRVTKITPVLASGQHDGSEESEDDPEMSYENASSWSENIGTDNTKDKKRQSTHKGDEDQYENTRGVRTPPPKGQFQSMPRQLKDTAPPPQQENTIPKAAIVSQKASSQSLPRPIADTGPPPQQRKTTSKAPIDSQIPSSRSMPRKASESDDQGFYDDTVAPKGPGAKRQVAALVASIEGGKAKLSTNEPTDVPPLPDKKGSFVTKTTPAGKFGSLTAANRPLPPIPPGHPYQTRIFHSMWEVPKDISGVGISGISDCLHLLRLDHYITSFAEHQIDGIFLQKLTVETFMESFQMDDLQARKLFAFATEGWRPKS